MPTTSKRKSASRPKTRRGEKKGSTVIELKKRAQRIYRLLKKRYPDATCALRYRNPLELLVSTILSAQCTDVRVNEVTKVLFQKIQKG